MGEVYKLLYSTSVKDLNKQVNEAIDSGFDRVGRFFAVYTDKGTVLYQPIMKSPPAQTKVFRIPKGMGIPS